jgi:hypothetical protein
MRNFKVVLLTTVLFACGSSERPAPSCQQALAHYYAAGCTYFDGRTNPPSPIPQGQMVTFCQDAAINAPASCQDELDVWLRCDDEVPDHSTTNEQCDCSQEQMELLRCR